MNQKGGFRFMVEEVFSVPGRGVAVQGRVESGTVTLGVGAEFLGKDGKRASGQVIAVEVARQMVEEAQAGQPAILVVEGIHKGQITRGTVLQEEEATPAPGITSAEPSYSLSVPAPSEPYLGKAIHPSSSLGRIVLLVIIGILVILAIHHFQGR
jgi:translation elongation factor EF-Tu-like GTPase